MDAIWSQSVRAVVRRSSVALPVWVSLSNHRQPDRREIRPSRPTSAVTRSVSVVWTEKSKESQCGVVTWRSSPQSEWSARSRSPPAPTAPPRRQPARRPAARRSRASAAAGADSGATYKIGFQGPLSGDNQQLGINEVNARRTGRRAGQRRGRSRLHPRAGQVRRRRAPGQGPGRRGDPAAGHRRRRRHRAELLRCDQGRRCHLQRGSARADQPVGDQRHADHLRLDRLPPHRAAGLRRGPAGRRLAGRPRPRPSTSSTTCPTTARVSATTSRRSSRPRASR